MSDTREEYRLYLPDFYPGEERLLEKLRLRISSHPPYIHLAPISPAPASNALVGWQDSVRIGPIENWRGFGHRFAGPPGAYRPQWFVTVDLSPSPLKEYPFRTWLMTMSLQRADEEQVESPLPEPAQEQPLQSGAGEALPGEGGVSPVGPFSDTLPQEWEVVEGVPGEAYDNPRRDPAAALVAINAVVDLYQRSRVPLGVAMDLIVFIRQEWG